MKVVVYGSCQLSRIYETYLQPNEYFKDAVFVFFPYYEYARQKKDLPIEDFKSADIFFFQPLSPKYGIYSTENGQEGVLQYIPESAIQISMPFFYLDIYPFYAYLDKVKCGDSLKKYKEPAEKIYEQFSNFELDFELEKRAQTSIQHIRKKEEYCTLHYSEFLDQYYKKIRCCTLWCHPTAPVYRYIVNQIYTLLKIPKVLDVFQEPFEVVHGNQEPESFYMKKELQLEYDLQIHEDLYRKFLRQWIKQESEST